MSRRRRHLYRAGADRRERSDFEARYGKERGDRVYGATVGKVARERAAHNPGGEMRERVRGHWEERNGRRFRVRPHTALIHSHPHRRGDHPGRCNKACQRGLHAHRHARRRRRR